VSDVETKLTQELPESVLATLAEIGEEINASLNLDRVLSKMATLIKRLIDYEIFTVMLLDERSQMLINRFAVGYSQEMMENWRIPIGQGISGAAAASRRPILVGDVRNDSRYINTIDGVRSELAVPLLFKNRVVGVIDIQSSRVDYFTSEQQEILVLLGSRLATAIENARLFERARSQADTLLLLHEVGREASSILDVEALLRRAAELVKRVIDYQIMSIMLYDPATNLFLQRLAVKYGQSMQGKLAVGFSEGIIGAAASTGLPVRVPDVTKEPRYRMLNPETRSELAIPMTHKGRVIGILDLESPQLNYFTEDHVQALSILAAQLAIALENARLYEKVAHDEARMERELQAAHAGRFAPAGPGGRLWHRSRRAHRFRARSLRRSLRFPALWPYAGRFWPGRRQRQRLRCRALWRRRHRHFAQHRPAKALARRTSAPAQSVDLRAPHRGALHDFLLCHLAQAHAQIARRQCGTDAAHAIQKWPL
jgi:sigma-B regulation protein RsbU (phosphoserine phosphatase)